MNKEDESEVDNLARQLRQTPIEECLEDIVRYFYENVYWLPASTDSATYPNFVEYLLNFGWTPQELASWIKYSMLTSVSLRPIRSYIERRSNG